MPNKGSRVKPKESKWLMLAYFFLTKTIYNVWEWVASGNPGAPNEKILTKVGMSLFCFLIS